MTRPHAGLNTMQRCFDPTQDLPARTPTEDGVRLDEEWFRAPFETTAVGMVEVSPDARILRANGAFGRMTGYTPGELGAMSAAELLFPEDRDRVLGQYGEVAAGRRASYEEDCRYRRKDGSPLWARVTVARDQFAVPARVAVLVIDLTERKQLEEQLWHAQKMETAGLLATCIAHDFNNLLTAINGAAYILLDKLPQGEPTHELARGMVAACQRAAELTTQLLTFGRKKVAAEPRILDLNGVVSQSVPLFRHLLGKGIVLVTQLAAGLGRVKADPAQVEQVILNLAVNAKDAMPRGGRLTIETRAVSLGESDGATGLPPGEYALLAVSDTGTGMTGEVKARAFEPFFTTKESGKGTGLGLSVVRSAIRRCGGQVSVTSEPGAGTTINIHLPTVATTTPQS